MEKRRKVCLLALLSVLFLTLMPVKTQAASAAESGLALLSGMDGNGEVLTAGLGFLRPGDGERPLFVTVSGTATDKAASYKALMMDGKTVSLELVGNYKEYGTAVFRAKETVSGYTPFKTASSNLLETGLPVIQVGLAVEGNSSRVDAKATAISGTKKINGATFYVMKDSFQQMCSGGPVVLADESAAGMMIQSEEYNLFLPVEFIENLAAGKGEGSAAGDEREAATAGAPANTEPAAAKDGTSGAERQEGSSSGNGSGDSGGVRAVASGEVPQAVRDQIRNVALVGVMDGKNVAASGLGFLVPANQHGQIFCTSAQLFAQETGSYLVINPDGSAGSEANIGLLNTDWGVALLGTQQELPGYSSPQAANADTISAGQTVYTAGLGADKGVQFLQAAVAGFTTVSGTKFIELSGQFPEGFVGGPLFTESGAVAGALVGKQGMNLALPIDTIMGALSGSSGKGGEGGGEAAKTAVQDEESPAVLVALIPIVALVLIITGVSYISGEFRKDTRGVEEFINPQSGAGASLLSIQGTGGLYTGRSFPIEGTVILGRDKNRCTIVYPEGSRGISSVHCRVVLSGEVLELTDLGSTYGTFLRDGTKLTPNSPYLLHRGDEFYLADVSNGFRVC